MAKIRLLIDTDVFVDAIRGLKPANDLFRSNEIDIYCSVLTKKELLSKEGLSASERKRINNLISKVKVLKTDEMIHEQFTELLLRYGDEPERRADYIIAATALAKRLPLLTRNRKHFKHIENLVLSPVYNLD
jgi:predicted nucleic acid-binding protein